MTFATYSGGGFFHGSNESEVPGVRDGVRARGAVRLRALLRPARGRLRRTDVADVDELRRRIQGGPQNIWRYADFLPLEGAAAARRAPGLPAGCTPLIRADRLAERLGLREVWVKNDAANPTHSFKDRVVVGRRCPRPELGFDVARLRLDRQPRQLRRRPRRRARAWRPTSSSRPTSRSRRSSRPASTARTSSRSAATTTTSTASAPSSRASATGRSSTSTCARTTPRARRPLAYEIAEQLGWEMPDRVVAPIASGSLFTKIAKGFEEWLELGLVERRGARR